MIENYALRVALRWIIFALALSHVEAFYVPSKTPVKPKL